jgi:hypothetical protein
LYLFTTANREDCLGLEFLHTFGSSQKYELGSWLQEYGRFQPEETLYVAVVFDALADGKEFVAFTQPEGHQDHRDQYQ